MEENRYMAKMRVHELAKELNIKSQDVIDTLNEMCIRDSMCGAS